MSEEEFKISNMFIDSLKTQQELYYKAKIEKIYQQKIKDLQQKVEQLENIRKEAIEYITKKWYSKNTEDISKMVSFGDWEIDLLNILNKGGNK